MPTVQEILMDIQANDAGEWIVRTNASDQILTDFVAVCAEDEDHHDSCQQPQEDGSIVIRLIDAEGYIKTGEAWLTLIPLELYEAKEGTR